MGDVAASYRGAIDGVTTDVSIAIEKLHGESGGGRMASRRRASSRLVSFGCYHYAARRHSN